jgi:ubiquitin carboxyl-terminal hydrolase 10
MGAFLRGFIMNVSAKKPVNGGAGGKGKGKVSPAEEQEQEPEAFIPTHIYDALKGKKRFDGIRVCLFTLLMNLGHILIRATPNL